MNSNSSKWAKTGTWFVMLATLAFTGCSATHGAKSAAPPVSSEVSAPIDHAAQPGYASPPEGEQGVAEPPAAPPPAARSSSGEVSSAPSAGDAPAKSSAGAPASRSRDDGYGYSGSGSESWDEGSRSGPAGAARAERRAPAVSKSDSAALAPRPTERPGLGTEWGQTRSSFVTERSFDRAYPNRPNGVVSVYYNDREGAEAMTRYADYSSSGAASVSIPGTDVTVTLRDRGGATLPAFFANGHTYGIGEAGQDYVISIRNDSSFEIEAVASVDGLDVIDGRSADYSKRGYLVSSHDSLEIDGFRKSSQAVAAFRFGSVRGSYAARTGTDRNVGVIGVAVFLPRSAVWTHREIARRQDADPFPSRYAQPPR